MAVHKAALFYEVGGPFKIGEVATPPVPPYGVLVRTRSVGVCHSDLHLWRGDFAALGMPKRLPWVVGHEIVGVVVERGPYVPEEVREGVPVLVYAWQPADEVDENVLEGYTQLAARRRRYAFDVEGGLQEYVVVPHYKYVIPLVGFEDVESAAPLGCAGLTSYNAVNKVRKFVKPGDFVLVVGLGGLGLYAIQWAKLMLPEANVIAVDVREEALDFASRLVPSITYIKASDAAQELSRLVGDRGLKAVLDFVSTSSTVRLYSGMLSTRGVYNLVGLMDREVAVPIQFLIRREASIVTTFTGSLADQIDVVRLARLKKIDYVSVVTKKYRFEEGDVNRAFNDLKEGRTVGRSVIVF
ncbi:MAG: alcohol dehydrogenase catalytic domain-containing protein [Pyrobaculum sp.]